MSYKSSHLGSVIDTSIQKIIDVLFLLKTGGTISGGLIIKPSTDAVNSISIQDKDGNVILSIDTVNNRIGIRTATPTSALFIHDNAANTYTGIGIKNDAGSTGDVFNIFGGWDGLFSESLCFAINQGPYVFRVNFQGAIVNSGLKYYCTGDSGLSAFESGYVGVFTHSGTYLSLKGGSPTGYIRFDTDYNDEAMRIKSGGLVGIGTTAPDKRLEINHATGQCLRLTYNDPNGSATYYADLTIDSAGNLLITPSGTQITCAVFPVTPSAAPTSNYQVANKKYVDDSSTAARPYQVCTLRFYTLVAGGDQGDPGDLTTLTFDVFENTIGTLEMEEPTPTNQIVFRFKDEAEEYISGLWWVNFPSVNLSHDELYDAGYSLPDTDEIRLTHPYDYIHNQIYYIEIRLYPSKDTFTADAFRVGD